MVVIGVVAVFRDVIGSGVVFASNVLFAFNSRLDGLVQFSFVIFVLLLVQSLPFVFLFLLMNEILS